MNVATRLARLEAMRLRYRGFRVITATSEAGARRKIEALRASQEIGPRDVVTCLIVGASQ